MSNDADVDNVPIFAFLSFANFGKADSDGLEVSGRYSLNEHWRFDFSSTFFSFGIGEEAPENILSANTPGKHYSAGVLYSGQPVSGFLKYRWVDDFNWAGGIYNGPVQFYSIVDLTVKYALSDQLTLGIDVANLFDDVHYEIFGGSLLRRRALAYLEISW